VTAESLRLADNLILVARFGVGYDSVDMAACTESGVIVTITPDTVGRTMAYAAITLMLAVGHKLLIKDRLTRDGRWSERAEHFGTSPADKTLGIIGMGRVGRELARLGAALGMRPIASDPAIDRATAQVHGAELVSLQHLLETTDVLVIACPLTPETYHLIDAAAIARMKPSAIVVNVARGPIVDQEALIRALTAGRLAGAGLDVFEDEPLSRDDPLTRLTNVVLAPHSLAWTVESFRDNGHSAARAVLDVVSGRVPTHIVNHDVLAHDRVKRHLTATAGLVS
jgi:D-3-phosphoglycerate dehydrogenase